MGVALELGSGEKLQEACKRCALESLHCHGLTVQGGFLEGSGEEVSYRESLNPLRKYPSGHE